MHPRLSLVAAVAAVAALLAPAPAAAFVRTGDVVPAAASPGPDPGAAARLRAAWRAGPVAGTIGSGPAFAGGSVYYTEDAYAVADPRHGERITRRDAATGRRLPFEAAPIETLFLTRPVADAGGVLTLSAYERAKVKATVRAYTPDGRGRWERDLPGEKFPTELVTAGPLVLAAAETGCDLPGRTGCEHTTVRAWWTADGTPAWQRTLAGGSPRLAAAGGQVAIHVLPARGAPVAGTLHALDATTGERRWSRSGIPEGVLVADRATVSVAAGRVWVLRSSDGTTRFRTPPARYTTATATGTGLIAATSGGRIVALDLAGRTRWTTPARPTGPLTVSRGVVWFQHFTAPDGEDVSKPTLLVGLHAATGRPLRRLPVAEGYSAGAVAVGGGRVFTTAYLTTIRAYAVRG